MSVKAMTWAWAQELRIGPKFVLVALADHSDGNGVCWPGHEMVAEKCGLSRQTVVEHIALLESMGLLVAERTRDSRGRAGKVRYFLQLDRASTRPGNCAVAASPMSEIPTLANVGISEVPMSGFHPPYKEEPKAIEPTPQTTRSFFSLNTLELRAWFDHKLWPLYPKKAGKGEALEALLHLAPDRVLLEAILSGLALRAQAEEIARGKGAFFPAWPDLHRWLRKRRWEDAFDVPRAAAPAEYRCRECGCAGVVGLGKSWYCAAHAPEAGVLRQPRRDSITVEK